MSASGLSGASLAFFPSLLLSEIKSFLPLYSDVRVSLAGRDLPEDVKARILDLQDERTSLEKELKETLQAKKDLEALMTRAKKVSWMLNLSLD